MARPSTTDQEFMAVFDAMGGTKAATILGVTERNVYARRERLEGKYGPITAPSKQRIPYPGRVPIDIKNGSVLIGSDFHIWPGPRSTCQRAFLKFCSDIKPAAVILNGDVMDFPRISRHPQNWESAPDPQEEIEAAQDYLNDIVNVCSRRTQRYWTLGNHDARFEGAIANAAPQYRGVKGVHLADHFGAWQKAMSCFINEGVDGGATMVKHIPSGGGVGATRLTTLKGGVSTVNGHLHSQNVRPVSDYGRFDRYGVDTGMVADKEHRAFAYAQDAALDWRSGFALLTYREGRLMYPELITKWDDKSVQWRGQVIRV
jgi:hypothetical protein